MTIEPNRVDAGVPTGGQFAAKTKSDHVVSLGAPTRRPELVGWPASVPEPELSVHIDDANVITTTVRVNGEEAFEFWNPGDDIHSIESSDFENNALSDPSDFEAAKAWAHAKHDEVSVPLRREMYEAVERSRARILAKATGATVRMTAEELNQYADANFAAVSRARREGELASAAVIARGVQAEHPDAKYIGLVISTADNGDYVSGATVHDQAGKEIASYDEDDTHNLLGDRPDRPFLQCLNDLDPNADESWWAKFNIPRTESDDRFTIDLAKASAWAPGDIA